MPEFDLDGALTGPPPGRVLEQPLSPDETADMFRDLGHVEGIITVDLSDIFEQSFESFLDDISGKLSDLVLGGLEIAVVGVTPPSTLYIKVTAGDLFGRGGEFDE